ncbi:nucleoside phosphorylase domain-containing protein [Xylogone sp. PMI_703]|nr:nucleoside phosphorylase domain-containing protein [Xylogone sp. PMI_703]
MAHRAVQSRYLHPGEYTVGWVCALPIELTAAEMMLDEEYPDLPLSTDDRDIYKLGRIGVHNVVLACLPGGQTGTNSAAAVAHRMRSKFPSLIFYLLVGVGGGVPSEKSDIRLGDVVISHPEGAHGGVVQYDFGKSTPSGFERHVFLNAPPTVLLSAVVHLKSKLLQDPGAIHRRLSVFRDMKEFSSQPSGPDHLFQSSYNHAGSSTCDECDQDYLVQRPSRGNRTVVVHYGTIASGNQVMRDGKIRDNISTDLGNVLCFEMEAAGLMNNFPCLVIRGICDYADSHKNKQWQPYAAGTASACAKELLALVPPSQLTKTPRVDSSTEYSLM